jgi:hypothetical protein
MQTMQNLKLNYKTDQRGTILLLFLITIPFLILLAMYYMQLSLTSFQVARFDMLHTEAQMAADAGADYSVEQMSLNNSWTGTGGEVTLQNANNVKTTFTSTVSGNSSQETVQVTGKTYWPANSTKPSRTVSIAVDLYPVTSGNYSIVAGAGGLVMANSAKVVGGSVLINGTISMANSSQIGLSTAPVTVSVADDVCPSPADATYPRVCTSSDNNGQPISINGTAHIYGTVNATNQTSGSGMSNTGLVAGGSAAPQSLPTYDRTGQKAAATNNMTGAAASCSNKQNIIWPANSKITGNVSLANQCTVTIQGNVWITGSLSLGNTSQIIVSNSLGVTRPVIMIDGSSGATFNQSGSITANSSGTGAEVITYYSTAGCSPDCSTVTGTNLANSRTITTINLGQSAAAANSIFYAYWTEVQLANTGQLGAVIGQTINLSNTATITFGSSSGTPTTTWVIKGYRRQ